MKPAVTLDQWRALRGDELIEAMRSALWYLHPGEAGWSITVVDLPPDAGYPVVADVPWKRVAEDIVAAHNTQFDG